MPRVKSTKRRVAKKAEEKPKDAKSEQTVGEETNTIQPNSSNTTTQETHNYYAPKETWTTTHNNYYTAKEELKVPEDYSDHWTKNSEDNRWKHLWHNKVQIEQLWNQYFEYPDWKLIPIINRLYEAQRNIINKGIVDTYTPNEDLDRWYYTGDLSAFKNYAPNKVFTYHKYADLTEPGEIIEEVANGKTTRSRLNIVYRY